MRTRGGIHSSALGAAALMLATVALARTAAAQERPLCEGIAFSTEEDFVTRGTRPADGNPLVSDGDLLVVSTTGSGAAVCARNRDLLRSFQVRVDLGLDAVDVIDAREFVIAFSTELDHPEGVFSAGDLLLTNGGVLPNAALLAGFDLSVRRDMGLDAVHLIGRDESIKKLVETIRSQPRDVWREAPDRLRRVLEELDADIWFSTEGTELPLTKPAFLDGDLLSARTGSIVARNSLLLPGSVPAGLPDRGVDFGLDAVTGSREREREAIHFSTEILFDDGTPSFNDGDVLRINAGVAIIHSTLIKPFEPRADFLGLDALHFPQGGEIPREPNIQSLCGRGYPDIDFNGGRVAIGGSGTGLYFTGLGGGSASPPRRPCGEKVAFDGYLPPAGVDRFRVAYRPSGATPPAPDTAPGVVTQWKVKTWQWFPFPGCYYNSSLSTDSNGWMDASDFLDARDGWPCTNPAMQLAVWDTKALGSPDKDGHFVVWLEWDDGALHREPVEHHVQLDNTLPTIAPFPNGLQVRLPGGGPADLVPACGEAPPGTSQFEVWSQFADDYYWRFRLRLRGGLPPASAGYGPHAYFDPTDGPPGLKNTDDTGTIPDLTTVHVRNIDMTDLGASFQDCCYVLDLWVRDAAIRHTFNGKVVNDASGSSSFQANAFVTFAAGP